MSSNERDLSAADVDSSPASDRSHLAPLSSRCVNSHRLPALRCAPRRLRERRGVLLLVVLSVLVLFVLLTVTYVIVATRERVTAKAIARTELSGDPPNQLCDALMMVLLRDTTDTHSPFRSWSLLEGIYGNVSFRGQVSGQTSLGNTGGQFIFLPVNPNQIAGYKGKPSNYFKGCVLTMVTGPCAGNSTRIVASDQTGITVMRLKTDAGVDANKPNQLLDPVVGDVFVVNGPAFSGMGRGYDPTYDPQNAMAPRSAAPNGYLYVDSTNNTSRPYALLPNSAYFQATTSPQNGMPAYLDPAGPGAANVDYTAYDYNNMYLGLVTNGAPGLPPVLPSFHRADLCAYWKNQPGGVDAALARKILFRPTTFDHPIFNATTNPNFNPIDPASPLDVDNMGTGIPDSIWIDPGLPVMIDRNGKSYKVMIAPLILDLDGRVNLNAHGSYTQVDPNFQYPANNPASLSAGAIAGGGRAQLPIGEGFGPADVNLLQLFSVLPPAQAQQLVRSLFNGVAPTGPTNSGWPGRHNDQVSSFASRQLAAVKYFEYPPDDYRAPPLTSFGNPPDVKGRRFLALDYRGLPLFLTMPTSGYNNPSDSYAADANVLWHNELYGDPTKNIADNPYEFNLFAPMPGRSTPNSGLDNPFTVAELEKVMRPYDVDNRALAPRLAALLQQALQSNPRLAVDVTVESRDVPTPSLAVPHDYRKAFATAGQARAFSIMDVVRARLQGTGVPPANWDAEISYLLAPELIAGLKMDINRPFGNGRDDKNSGIVDGFADEDQNGPQKGIVPGLTPGPNGIPNGAWPNSYPNNVQFNITNGQNGNGATDPLLANTNISAGWKARQLMARHLYTLMMLFTDQGYVTWINPAEKLPSPAAAQELTARRVAQWAINAVCFRDSTSAMTPFVYHAQMFSQQYTGWKVNGDPGDQSQQSISDRRVVWGCKPPDVLLTETAAFHDRRTANTSYDGNNNTRTDDPDKKKRDIDFDQTRVPQGTALFELYCCRNPNNPIAPGDLYVYDATNKSWKLDLGRMTPDGKAPVWRMLVTESPKSGNVNANVTQQMADHPDSFCAETIEPAFNQSIALQLNLVDNKVTANVDRVIWLGSKPPAAGSNTFYNRNGATYLFPSQYALIGPRSKTAVGAKGTSPYGQPCSQVISITPAGPTTTKTANDPVAADIKQPLGVIVAADAPSGANGGTAWTDPGHKKAGIGINISEPLPQGPNYYKEPTIANPSALDPANKIEFYGDPAGDKTNPFLDHPLEGPNDPLGPSRPLLKDGVAKTGTYAFYKHVFLQRLADPSLPWDSQRNPYITVDSMPIDLTTFNGEQPFDNSSPLADDPDDKGSNVAKVQFASRQRGGSDPAKKDNLFNLWAPITGSDALPPSPGPQRSDGNFKYQLQHTLTYLNAAWGPGFRNPPPAPGYVGDPQKPFPWITWNARPYSNLMELLLVPASSADRLFIEFSTPDTNPAQPAVSPYGFNGTGGSQDYRQPFGHLLNFLHSTDQIGTPAKSANYYRILDYLRVPSRFVGTETMLNPNFFQASNPALSPYLPPFNSVSNYRDPGLVNPNTITSPDVWNAVMNNAGIQNFGPAYQQWVDSRRGDGAAGSSLITSNPALPTSFAGALRSAASADLVPLPSMMQPAVTATMLRPNRQGKAPLFSTASVMDYNNSSRNPYFAYQPLERVSNLMTPRSNVFAVWLTIGYFEVLPWPQAGINPPVNQLGPADFAAHADGYQLGAELGSDTGEIIRHRAFYIIDRSIPVGYERGQNHNTNRAILLRRFIE